MARAKSTARAEARRRYRAAQTTSTAEGEPEEEDLAPEPEEPPQRRSLFALPQIDWRGDLALFPSLLRTSRLIWLGVAVIMATAVVFALAYRLAPASSIVAILNFVVGFVIIQPPSIVVLVVGLFTPRAAWLVGGFLGLVQTAALALILVVAGTSQPTTVGQASLGLLYDGFSFIVFGALFGGLASWYRRFLSESSARNRKLREERERQKRRQAKQSSRGARPVR